jgi:lipopolysaccharide export system protein LptA
VSRFIQTTLLNIILACCWATVVNGAPLLNTSANEPIHVEAERMESNQQEESVLFTGNVEAIQGILVIRADLMTVFYRKSEEDSGSEKIASKSIDKLQASGNVKIIQDDWLASGDEMEYKTEGRKVVLTGNSKIWQGNSTVTGERIVLYLDEGKSIVENQSVNSGERVKAFFYPEPDNTDKNN